MKPSVSMFLLLAAAGCADEANTSTTTAPLSVLSHDCDVDAGYELDTLTSTEGGKLQIVGVYEARNGDAPWWADPECMACLEDPNCSASPDYDGFCN
ncbi:MAG: hypothetical protein H0V17_22205, partial [Deltaproteobacteria bacterium]|nr:hypothetical protein [Deltaproteobacteria bacterium]